MQSEHIPVFENELIAAVRTKDEGVYVDATLGGGGHFFRLLNNLISGKLIGIDLDTIAIERAEQTLQALGFEKSVKSFVKGNMYVHLANDNFANIREVVADLKSGPIDGIMADLGFSSDQLSTLSGLSYTKDEEPLDMRLNKSMGNQASDVLNKYLQYELINIFKNFAELTHEESMKLTSSITKTREIAPIKYVSELNAVIKNTFPDSFEQSGSRYLPSRIYQALRMEVNNEVANLQRFLADSFDLLNVKGKFAVITFHSGETKIVEKYFADLERKRLIKREDSSFIRPSVKELRLNLRARSAKLFSYQKL